MPATAESGAPARYARVGVLFWLLGATAWLFVQLGYSFESNDQVQYLLLPYRSIYPDFLPGDWFTWSTSHYHITFSWLVRALHALCGEAYFRFGVVAAHVLSLLWLAYAMLRLARSLGAGVLEASIPVFVFGCARDAALGGALINHGCLLPSDLAFAPLLLACAACLDQRPRETGVWLGIAGFLHANFAVLGPVVVVPVAAALAWPRLRAAESERRGVLLELAWTCGIYTILAAPSLVLLASSFLAGDRDPSAVAITLFVRSPHHYDLASMSALDFAWAGVLALVTLPAWVGRYALQRRAAALMLCGIICALIALGVLGAGAHLVSLARLFTFRLSIPLFAIWLIVFGCVARAVVMRRDLGALVWLAAALAVLALFVREDVFTLTPFSNPPQRDPRELGTSWWLIATVVVPFALATLASMFLAWRRTPAIALLAGLPLAVSLWVAQIPLGQVWTGTRYRAARSFHFADRKLEWTAPDRDLYAKVREQTPHDARFLIAPGLFEFRMRARRNVFVDWKCAPMRGDEASEWKRRMLAAMGTADFPSRGYTLPTRADALYYARPLEELLDLARRERLDYAVVRKSQLRKHIPGIQLLFTSGALAVLQIDAR